MAQGNYIAPPHQTTVFDLPPELSKVPSLSGSPVRYHLSLFLAESDTRKVSSTYEQFPAPMHQAYYPHIVDEPMQFGSYPMPMTPSDFGSDHDSPYCSPRPLQHPEPTFSAVSVHSAGPAERTHTTSGVRSTPTK
jgi:AP-1-like factor